MRSYLSVLVCQPNAGSAQGNKQLKEPDPAWHRRGCGTHAVVRHPQANFQVRSSSSGGPGGQSEEQLKQHVTMACGSGAVQQGP